MRKIILLLITLVTITGADAQSRFLWFGKKNKQTTEVVSNISVEMKNEIDSMSYALGVNIAYDLMRNLQTLPGGEYNTEIFLKGFNTVLRGDSALMTNEDSNDFLQEFFTAAQEKATKQQRSEGEKFLEDNAKNPAVQKTASGLQYIVLRDAQGPKPVETDRVKVHYEGTLVDGTKFDSSYDRGDPIEFTLNQVIRGWTEGVMLMSPGAKYKFFIPYHLGYGEAGAGGVIPPYATLIFTVELIEINPGNILNQIQPLEIK